MLGWNLALNSEAEGHGLEGESGAGGGNASEFTLVECDRLRSLVSITPADTQSTMGHNA